MGTATSIQPRRLVPLPEAWAALGGIGHTTGYELVNQGKLTKVNIGRRAFITADSIDAYVAELTGGAERAAEIDAAMRSDDPYATADLMGRALGDAVYRTGYDAGQKAAAR